MRISTRKEAKTRGESQYFTGARCKNGHISYRYTASGTCAECVATSTNNARRAMGKEFRAARQQERIDRNAKNEEIALREVARAEALAALATVRVLAHNFADRDTLHATAIELCLATYPELSRSNFEARAQPVKAGSSIYFMKVPEAHIEMLRAVERELGKVSGPNAEAIRRTAFSQVEKMANDEAYEPPVNFK